MMDPPGELIVAWFHSTSATGIAVVGDGTDVVVTAGGNVSELMGVVLGLDSGDGAARAMVEGRALTSEPADITAQKATAEVRAVARSHRAARAGRRISINHAGPQRQENQRTLR
jgi:hypothetical protein